MNNEEAIEEIMDWFDFEKVHKTMECLNWKWGNEVPLLPEIRKYARDLLRDAVRYGEEFEDSEGCTLMCGGFRAEYVGRGKLRLMFVVSDWSSNE